MNPAFLRIFKRSNLFYNHSVLQGQGYKRMSVAASASIIAEAQEKKSFQNNLQYIIDPYLKSPIFDEVPEVISWLKKIFDYHLVKGKNNRGLTTVFAYKTFERPGNITEEKMTIARILGWCMEMLQTYFVITDDIMDGSTTRRGATCWHLLPEVGISSSINDSTLVHSSLFEILRMSCGHLPDYHNIFHRFKEAILLTSLGQHLDYTMAQGNKNDYSKFTINQYDTIVTNKTSYYTFWLPVDLGLLLANVTNEEVVQKSKEICLGMGKLLQMKNDYIDCYSDAAVTGKVGTDIQERKCSWLAVTALQHFSSEQRDLFQKLYGSSDTEHVQTIKRLYNAVNLRQIYKDDEKACYYNIVSRLEQLDSILPTSPELFLKVMDMYKIGLY